MIHSYGCYVIIVHASSVIHHRYIDAESGSFLHLPTGSSSSADRSHSAMDHKLSENDSLASVDRSGVYASSTTTIEKVKLASTARSSWKTTESMTWHENGQPHRRQHRVPRGLLGTLQPTTILYHKCGQRFQCHPNENTPQIRDEADCNESHRLPTHQ